MNEYKLKDKVNFKLVNDKSKIKYDFDLSDYYDKETRLFEFPKGYVAWHLMAQVFSEFLIPLNLVDELKDSDD